MDNKITIIGGGIGGLTLANALLNKGIPFQIYEAASNYLNVGGGHWLYANALRTLDEIDSSLVDDMRSLGHDFDGFLFTDIHKTTIVHKQVETYISHPRYKPIVLHRADIIHVLEKRLPKGSIRFGKRIKHIKNNTLYFTDGTSENHRILIGADGIHSKTRDLINQNITPIHSKQIGIWGISEGSLPKTYGNLFLEMWGNGTRVGMTYVGANKIYWFMVVKSDKVQNKVNDVKAFLKENGKEFPKDIMQIILSSKLDTIKFNPLYDLPIISKWYSKTTCCIGDAIHACTPNLGQGGCQAIEDGYWLAEMLKKYPNPEMAFQHFQTKRKSKTIAVTLLSRWLGQLAQSEGKFNCFLRNLSARNHPKKLVDKILHWIMNTNQNDLKYKPINHIENTK